MFVPASTLGPIVVPVVHALLAIGVTVHVLLHKRDAGSSVAWIGLAWLTPILGSVLYLLLGINRVRRRARNLNPPRPGARAADSSSAITPDDPLAQLERAGERITDRRTEPGNAIDIIQNGDQAYPQMIAAIEAARCSVALSSYIFRSDAAGLPFIDALSRAKQRGVEVRVLIDGIGGGYFRSETYHGLRRAGVPAARFMHSTLPWRMPFLNLRNHKKILITDGCTAFTGGLNIGAENFVLTHPLRSVFDTHFKVQGPVVAQLLEAFADDWNFATGQPMSGEAWFPMLHAVGDHVARVVTSGPNQDLEKIEFMILSAVGCARSSIGIMTPYFLPDQRLITALELASYRGVEVDVVLPEHSNHPTVDWGARVQIGPLLAAGCRVWTHPAPFNHSKLMTVDGQWCLVGSSNWDVRSFRLNFELDLEVYHAEMAGKIEDLIRARQGSRLLESTLHERSLAAKLRDGAAQLMLPYL